MKLVCSNVCNTSCWTVTLYIFVNLGWYWKDHLRFVHLYKIYQKLNWFSLILFNFRSPIDPNYRINFKTYSRISTLSKTWPSTQISAILLSCNKAWKNWDSNFSLRLLKHFKDLILRHLVHSTCSFVQYYM